MKKRQKIEFSNLKYLLFSGMFLSGIGQWAPRAENAKIDVKVIGASQEMCNYLPLLQKLPAALVIRKVKVTKHSSRVSLREIFT